MVSIYGLINTSGVFQSYFKSHHLQDYNYSQIGWIFCLYLFLVFLVGVQIGPVFDGFGPRVLVGARCTLIVLGRRVRSIIYCGSLTALIVISITFRASSGSSLGLIPVCLVQFCESGHYGRYFATATMFASFGTLISVHIVGALLGIGDELTSWVSLILFSGCSYLVALVCYFTARVMTVGWLPQTKS